MAIDIKLIYLAHHRSEHVRTFYLESVNNIQFTYISLKIQIVLNVQIYIISPVNYKKLLILSIMLHRSTILTILRHSIHGTGVPISP